uniref:Regulator of chromosome condensation 1 n=1 Tax=Plectus sambesii TaxID=2011161 RepID=A0A914UP49_9BILA
MFGKGSDGALGFGLDLSNKSEPTWLKCDALITADVVDVSCSVGEHRGHTLVLTSCGTVFAFGSNYNGKLGVGDQETRLTPSRIPAEYLDNQPVVAISAGGVHSGAIVADGRVFTWGCGKDGRLGHPDFQAAPNSYHETRPKEVAAITKILGSTRRKSGGLVSCDVGGTNFATHITTDQSTLS